MTDNEKRAHDLALINAKLFCETNISSGMDKDAIESGIYQSYKAFYDRALLSLNLHCQSD